MKAFFIEKVISSNKLLLIWQESPQMKAKTLNGCHFVFCIRVMFDVSARDA